MQLEGKVALVTGGTKGIGLGIADALLAEGASVMLVARDPGPAEKVIAERAMGERLAFVAADVVQPGQIEAAIDATLARYGRLDILVNNAGGSVYFKEVTEVTDEMWRTVIDLNLTSAFRAMRHVIPIMKAQGGGRIVNISSMRSKKQTSASGPYSAAKAGLNALTKAVAFEVGDFNITVNAICVGLVVTERAREASKVYAATQGLTQDELFQQYANEQMPSRRLQTPETMGALTVFFCSEAGRPISGVAYSADGGLADY